MQKTTLFKNDFHRGCRDYFLSKHVDFLKYGRHLYTARQPAELREVTAPGQGAVQHTTAAKPTTLN